MKELIYLDVNALSPAGGPLGVGYYLHEESLKLNIHNIEFIESDPRKKIKEGKQKKFLYKFPKITKIVRTLRHIREYNNMFYYPKCEKNIFDKYDIVHFHRTSDMYKQRKNLENYNGIVLLTSHSPIPLAEELKNACATKFERRYFNKRIKEFEEMDYWSFTHADYIVFPCPEAEEPYYNNWEKYGAIHEMQKERYKYVLTGISPRKAKLDINVIRNSYDISKEDFVITYVGRHNEVKGYGNLKILGERVLKKNKDIKFLIAGTEGPLTRLNNSSWIEVGFTKDPYSIIASSDVFILPNKETYFDLVMIEVLSLGKIVIASRTGGNKYFERVGLKGVLLYDTLDEAEKLINMVKNMPLHEKERLEKENLDFYKNHLTSEVFFENYLEMLRSIYKDLEI